ncbi:MAG: imidazolonepropionase [Anaerolineae bacterium]|nr:imidazolonepropionase [Anaerolineae bacterium]
MTNQVDLIVDQIGQLCTIPAHEHGPQRGAKLGDLGIRENAAIAVTGGKIVAIGRRDTILEEYAAETRVTARGKVVTPGFVDPHTHLVWMGDRADEFEMRAKGATYSEIMAAGGGINRTVRQTRSASLLGLMEATKARLDRMLEYGTTTVEIKTGYGLDLSTELAMLSAIALLDAEHPIDLVPTFLGAHAVPPEYASQPDQYVEFLIQHVLPAVVAWKQEHWPGVLYCDAFCENGAFTLDQTRRIFDAARSFGLPLRLHADEFESLGGTALAVEMGARSVDHLLATTPEDAARLGASDTVAILLPATPFGLNITNTAPIKLLLAHNAAIALATDCNPGTAWCESTQMVLALATRTLKLTTAQALAATTINAAYALDKGDQVGSLEVGKQADLVIWDIPDFRHLGYRFGANLVSTVIKRGSVVFEQNLNT